MIIKLPSDIFEKTPQIWMHTQKRETHICSTATCFLLYYVFNYSTYKLAFLALVLASLLRPAYLD